ncbi:MAG: TonB-dependent receptor [Colwellia sp.]|nr:TonB-dependent receptor [Colwellia sp.]
MMSALLICPSSVAQGISIEDIFALSMEELMKINVTTLSRTSEQRDLASGSIYVFTKEMIQSRGYTSLEDILRTVPGFTVFYKTNGLVAGVRGLNANDNEKITLLINGHESNNLQETEFLNGPINLKNLERVEVVVGPSSFFQRANTLAATVNIITKKIEGTEVHLGSGNDTNYSATVIIGKRWEEDFITASLTLERKEGFDAWDENYRSALANTTWTGQIDPSIFATLEAQKGNFWGQAIIYKRDAPDLNLNQGGNDATYQDHMFLLNLKHTFAINDGLILNTLFDVGHKSVQRFNDDGPAARGLEIQYKQRDYSGEFGFEDHSIENHTRQFGLQWSYEDNLDTFAVLNSVQTTLVDNSENTYAIGLYAHDTWQVNSGFKLETGLRVDYNSLLNDSELNWGGRLVGVFQMTDSWITKFITNRAVRYPSPIAALNIAWGADKPDAPVFANTSLNASKPEILTTFEWANILYWHTTRFSSNVYYQQLTDFISWNSPYTNVGDFGGYGIELELQHSVSEQFKIWANTSFVDSELDLSISQANPIGINEDKKIFGSPSFTLNSGFEYALNNHLEISGQLRYFTDQTSYSRITNTFEQINNRYYLDVTTIYKDFLTDGLILSLAAQNIFDNRRHVAVQWTRNQYRPRGRSLLLTLSSNF